MIRVVRVVRVMWMIWMMGIFRVAWVMGILWPSASRVRIAMVIMARPLGAVGISAGVHIHATRYFVTPAVAMKSEYKGTSAITLRTFAVQRH